MIGKFRTFLAGLGAVVCLSAQAAPVDFAFRFDNRTGNTEGVVTGRILGLQDNLSGQAATSLVIDSYSGLGGALEEADAVTWSLVHLNAFNVQNGELIGWDFVAQTLNGGASDHFFLSRALGSGSCQNGVCLGPLLSMDNGATTIANGQLTFTSLTEQQAVPEPTTLALVGIGALGLLAARRKTSGRGS